MEKPYYVITSPPTGRTSASKDSNAVVSIIPWRRSYFTIGGVPIKGRKAWGASDPIWQNEVVYYNTKTLPLLWVLGKIVIHHTNNNITVMANERKQQARGYAAIAYHFFIDTSGTIFEGRPLEVMGSHAGAGITSGPQNDPDWGAVGIVLQGDYHHADDRLLHDTVPTAQLLALERLVTSLKDQYAIKQLLLHNEIDRAGEATVCPGDHLAPLVEKLRFKLKMRGRA